MRRLGERGALDDVDRLVENATANRLYNAACAVAILSETAADPRLQSHAIDLLAQALKAGFPARDAAADPDLKPICSSRRWNDLMAGAGSTGCAAKWGTPGLIEGVLCLNNQWLWRVAATSG